MGKYKAFHACRYNEGVNCHPAQRRCESCVWNPDVEKRRKEQLREALRRRED